MPLLHTTLPATASSSEQTPLTKWLGVAATVLATAVAVLLASFLAVAVALT